MKVQEFMKKHGIGESRVRIYDAELGTDSITSYQKNQYQHPH